MRARAILSEAFRNLLSGAGRPALMIAVYVVLCATIGATEVMAISGIIRDGDNFRAAGASTFMLSAPAGVDGIRCESLGNSPNVTAAGAMREARGNRLTALPVSGVTLREVTTGFLNAIAPATGRHPAPRDGVAVPESLAKSLDIRPGEYLASSGGPLRIGGLLTYADDGRDQVLDNSILGVVPGDGLFDECWISLSTYDRASLHLLSTSIVAAYDPDGDVTVRQLNSSLGERFDGATRFAERPTRHAPYLAFGATALLALAGVWSRRLALASDRHAGVRRFDQLAMLTTEAVAWGLAGLLVVLALTRTWLELTGYSAFTFDQVVRIGAAGFFGVLAGTLVGWSLVREKRLFAYFKHR
ncbi:hypothetical protein [Actinoplanes teichomyceticus]|uniref:ABC transport system permease protein n=1 Tax=Actinoplanes teichomyceticus TaxID=1867 RepID=A0A561VSX3_ACTTI|nr:hypothetical protein [Actinoplanes teichomyceticus]TWG14703.1 hypothetical protein FHX34_1041009 [Actinoplanes teichomyceticus]GIF10106.1 hypothetical protein Ate01nite_01380 [Actinoplanes teichomyceticus]